MQHKDSQYRAAHSQRIDVSWHDPAPCALIPPHRISPGSPLTSPGFPISPEVSGVSLCCEPHEIAHEFAHEITSSIWSDSRTVRAAEQIPLRIRQIPLRIRRRPIRKQVSRVRLRRDQPRRYPTRPAQIRDESGGGGGGGEKGSPNWLNPPGGGGGGEANDSPKPAPNDGADAKPNVGSGGGGGGGSLKLNISLGAAAAPPAPDAEAAPS
jgi:hypothetical protein